MSDIRPQRENRRPAWQRQAVMAPVSLLLAGAVLTSVLWLTIERNERERTALEVQITAEQVRLRLQAWIDSRTALVRYLGNVRYSTRRETVRNFSDEAGNFHELYPGIQALNFIDNDWIIRIVVPGETNESALNRDLHEHPDPAVAAAIARADSADVFTRTPIISLLQGGKGFATYQPLHIRTGVRVGFVNAVFRIDALIDNCLTESSLRERFRFELTESDSVVAYAHPHAKGAEEWPAAVTLPVRIVDQPWMLRLAPKPEALYATRFSAEDVFVGMGFVLSVVMALMLRTLLKRQEALHESRSKYQLLVENQVDLVVKVDRDGRFLYASPSYCRTFGVREERLLGREFLPLVLEDDWPHMRRAMESLLHAPYYSDVEVRSLTQQGLRWLAWSQMAVLGEDGEVEAIVGVGRDVSRRRELEDQLFQSQKLQAIGQLGGGIAHDFNNILQALRGHVEIMLEDVAPDDPNQESLQLMHESIIKASGLTRQLLAFSRRQVLRMVLLDLNQVIADHLRMLRRIIGERVELVYEPAPRPLHVKADQSQLEQVLLNLCVNARDAITGAGTITITTAARHMGAEAAAEGWREGDYAVFSVADDGHGIANETRKHIFEPFFTTKQEGQGTGLGLATVFGIVRQHEGQVTVESELGEGSVFAVHLPLAAGEVAADEDAEPDRPTGGHETVLIAEDDADVRKLATRVLSGSGYTVLEAPDGAVGVEMFAANRERIDLVILDVVMPRMGGHEAARAILAQKPAMPILFTSGYDPKQMDGDRAAVEVRHFLSKPYAITELLGQVRTILDSRCPA